MALGPVTPFCPFAVPLTMLPVGLKEAWQGWCPSGPSSLAGLSLRDPWQVSASSWL